MKSIMPTLGWVMIGLALVVSFGIDLVNSEQGGALNLRNRITGARVFEHGIDAYRYKWHEGEPLEYCDPYNNPYVPVSKTTVTPTLLMLNIPLAALPYRPAQLLWLVLQWGLLLGTGWLWWRECATSLLRWLVVLFVTGFSYTFEWRWHAERGQTYVLLGFLFAFWLTTTMNPKRGNGFGPGFLAGFLVALRPTFFLLLPFLALHRRGQLAGAAAGLLLGIVLPLLIHPTVWSEYASAMKVNSDLYRSDYQPAPDWQNYPPEIEGVPTRVLLHPRQFPYSDFCVHSLLVKWRLEPVPDLLVLFAFGTALAFWLWRLRGQPAESLLPGMAAWLFLADLFLPAARFGYYDVVILNVVLSGIVVAKKFPWAAWPCALAVPLSWLVVAIATGRPSVNNLPAFFFTLGAVLFLFSFTTRTDAGRGQAT